MTASPIRVLLADDHALVRRGVRETLEEAVGEGRRIEVVAEAGDGAEALEAMRALGDGVDVVVADLSMPGMGGLELISLLHAEAPTVRVLVLSTHGAREVGVQVLDAGGAGYVEKAEAPEQVARAVRRVAEGKRVIGPALAEALADRALGGGDAAEGSVTLAPRELQVVRAMIAGQSPTEIAQALSISPSTVSSHRARAMAKAGVTTDAALAARAIREGWVEP